MGSPLSQWEGKEGAAGVGKVQEAKQVSVAGGTHSGWGGVTPPSSPPAPHLPRSLALILAGGPAHMLLTHPSALRDSWEGCEALHVPKGGQEAGKGGWLSAPGPLRCPAAPKGKRHQLGALSGFRHQTRPQPSWSSRSLVGEDVI